MKIRLRWPLYHSEECYECEGGWNLRWPLAIRRRRPTSTGIPSGVLYGVGVMASDAVTASRLYAEGVLARESLFTIGPDEKVTIPQYAAVSRNELIDRAAEHLNHLIEEGELP